MYWKSYDNKKFPKDIVEIGEEFIRHESHNETNHKEITIENIKVNNTLTPELENLISEYIN